MHLAGTQEPEVRGPEEHRYLILDPRVIQGVVYPESRVPQPRRQFILHRRHLLPELEPGRDVGDGSPLLPVHHMDGHPLGEEESPVEELELEGALAPPQGGFRAEAKVLVFRVLQLRQTPGKDGVGGGV